MPSPYTAATASTTTALAYATQRHMETLCDGSLISTYQSAANAVSLVHIASPASTPTFTTLTQSFSISGGSNVIADLFVSNNGTTTSDVWVSYCDNNTTVGLYIAHGTYTASGGTWSWDNTGTSIPLGSFTNGYMISTVVWTGTNLVIAMRGNAGNYGIALTYTTTLNGSTGWSAVATLDGGNSSSHCYPVLVHDATNGCSICVYSLAGDTVYARVLADTATPAVANWSARATLSGTVNVGAANISATLDPASRRLHVTYMDSTAANDPQYVASTYTTTAITPGSPISVGSAASTATGCVIGLDAASPPNAYVFWASGAIGSASDINYAKIASPYTSASAATNLTNASAHDNAYPHIPTLSGMTSVVPVLYNYAVSPYTVAYDNSITLTVALSGAGTITEHGTLSATGSVAGVSAGVITAHATLAAAGVQSQNASATIQGSATLSANTGTRGTGIGDIVRSSGTQYANKSGSGYGTGDISGTEYDYRYTDSTGSGWAIGANPWYGGMPASAWYQIDPTLNATLPQRTSATGNLMSLLTTQSGGIVHWEEAGPNGYQASELVTFQKSGNFTELAPANTPFRAYIKAVGDAPDANGISWTSYMCVYPGDPGLVVFRFDQHNGTASAISVDESDIELIASLLTDTGQNPQGIWNRSNGFIGTIGGTVTNGWPAPATHQNGTFDYMGITPDSGYGISLGTGAAVLSDPSVDFGWTQGGYECNDSGTTTTPGRIKIGFYSDVTSNWNIPAGQTNTYYVLRVFKRNLATTDMAAIAADFKYPGTPTTTTGSFTQFVVDERAYQFAATNNQVTTTLDLSPAHVTVRYKPVLKITGWTSGGAPTLSWGGSSLTSGTDFRYYNDTANQTLYIQLYFDVVGSNPQSGQLTNATLNVQGVVSGSATIQGHATLSANNRQTVAVTGTITEHGSLSAAGQVLGAGSASIQTHGRLSAQATQIHFGAATVQGHAQLDAVYSPNRTPTVLQSHASLSAIGSVVTPLVQTPLNVTVVTAIADNIAKALLDLQTAFASNIVTTTPTLATMQAGIQQLTQRIGAFYDITQEAALGPAALVSAKQALQFLTLNQRNFYPIYGQIVSQLDQYLGGLSAFLIQQQAQVHPQFADLFNYIAQNAPILQLANTTLTPISPRSVFLTNPITLGTLIYQHTANGSYSSQAFIDTTRYGDAPLSLTNVGTTTVGAGASLSITYQQWDGSSYTLSYMLQAALNVGASQALPITGVRCSSMTPTANGAAGNTLTLCATPLRTVSY